MKTWLNDGGFFYILATVFGCFAILTKFIWLAFPLFVVAVMLQRKLSAVTKAASFKDFGKTLTIVSGNVVVVSESLVKKLGIDTKKSTIFTAMHSYQPMFLVMLIIVSFLILMSNFPFIAFTPSIDVFESIVISLVMAYSYVVFVSFLILSIEPYISKIDQIKFSVFVDAAVGMVDSVKYRWTNDKRDAFIKASYADASKALTKNGIVPSEIPGIVNSILSCSAFKQDTISFRCSITGVVFIIDRSQIDEEKLKSMINH